MSAGRWIQGRGRLIALATLSTLALAACTTPPQAPHRVGLANPASVACVQAGGRLEIERSAAGERGICLLPGGLRCDEWAWFRKEAGACCSTNLPSARDGLKSCSG
ncbi:MAG: DUF333 domain-containing protein [Betaproteobacteria bacterium]